MPRPGLPREGAGAFTVGCLGQSDRACAHGVPGVAGVRARERIATARTALLAAGADIAISSVAELYPALESAVAQA